MWESAQSLAGDQDKQMTDGTQGCAAERGWAAAARPGAHSNPGPWEGGGGDGTPVGGPLWVLGAVSHGAASRGADPAAR